MTESLSQPSSAVPYCVCVDNTACDCGADDRPERPKRRYVIHVCPECGEQVENREWDAERGAYYGHYHDPPAGWPGGEDPWVDAIEVEVVLRYADALGSEQS